MDDKIFVKEDEVGGQNRTQLIIVGIAVVLVIVGVLGIIILTSSGTQESTQEEHMVIEDEVAEDEEIEEIDTEPIEETGTEEESAQTNEEESSIAEETESASSESQDTVSISDDEVRVYFIKAGALSAVKREKPEEYITSSLINELFKGPNSAERSQGYTKTWDFGSSSTCGASKSYKYTVSGSLLKLELCREFTGSNKKDFVNAVNKTITEVGEYSKVAVIDTNGKCLDTNDTSCLN